MTGRSPRPSLPRPADLRPADLRGAARRAFARLRAERRGSAAIEFAFALPVLLILLIGLFDLGQMAYIKIALHGVVEQVARHATLEGTNTDNNDAFAQDLLRGIAPGAQVVPTRASYYDYADVKRPEAWNDTNANGVCDNSEAFVDENRNGKWDADIGVAGNGGANDVVLYTVTIRYTPMFSLPIMPEWIGERTLSATSVRKNQPFALQTKYGVKAGTCK